MNRDTVIRIAQAAYELAAQNIVEQEKNEEVFSDKEVAEEVIMMLIQRFRLDHIRFFPYNRCTLDNVAKSILSRFRMDENEVNVGMITDVFTKCLKDGFYDIPIIKGDYREHLPPEEQ